MKKLEKIAILGIGRVGLPLSLIIAETGFTVYGIDVREDYVNLIKSKKMPFVEEEAQELLEKQVGKNFFPTTEIKHLSEVDIIILTLGTPVDEHLNPDFKQINSVLHDLKDKLRKGQLIILRSTVSPGTTEYIKEFIEKNTSFQVGKDLFLAFCPERIAEGKAIVETKEIPQIIGGIDKKSSEMAKNFFSKITKECILTDSRSAELAKIFTNMYRYINFSISNEFMILAEEHERNIYEILHLINYNYKRGGVKSPGYTAGPCLYKDGFFLVNTMPFTELISTSWKINETTPLYLLKKVKEMKGSLKGKKVVILGMSFKADIDDTRNSLSFKIKNALIQENTATVCHDPLVKEFNSDLSNTLKDADVLFIGINHSFYKKNLSIDFLKKLVKKDCIVCDIWNLLGKTKICYSLKEV